MTSDTPALDKFHELLRKELIDQGKIRTCLTCDHFNLDKCTRWPIEATPPPNVIVYGCDHWEYFPF